MPHIKIEYSSNLIGTPSPETLLPKLHKLLPQTGTINMSDIKSRMIRCDNFHVADGDPKRSFLHCEIALLEGRDVEIRKNLALSVMELLTQELSSSASYSHCSVSVEIREMNRTTYVKGALEGQS